MDDRRLEAFIIVAEELNFTRAAERLHVTQSTVSATIKALEEEIGVPLLFRTTRSVALTSAGARLLPEAKTALGALDRARGVAHEHGELHGTLALGTLGGLQSVDIPALAGTFRKAHPKVDMRVEISPRGTSGLLERLRNGYLDAVIIGEAQREPDLVVWPIRTFTMAVFVPSGHPLAEVDSVSLADLVSTPFVDQPVGFWQRTIVDAAFAARGLRRQITMEVMDLRSMPDFVAHGLGIAILPDTLFTTGDTRLRALPLQEEGLDWTVSMAGSSRRPLSRAAEALVALLPAFIDTTAAF